MLPLVASPGWTVLLSLLATIAAILSLVLGYRTNKQTRESAELQARETRESAERQAAADREHVAAEARRSRLLAQREKIYAEAMQVLGDVVSEVDGHPRATEDGDVDNSALLRTNELSTRIVLFGTYRAGEIFAKFQVAATEAQAEAILHPRSRTREQIERVRSLYSEFLGVIREDLEVLD